MAQKFYVVWAGRRTGVFTDWDSAQTQVHGFAGARFKSFPTRTEAEHAFRAGPSPIRRPAAKRKSAAPTEAGESTQQTQPGAPFEVQIYCDGACDPNPGNAGSGAVIYRNGTLSQLWYGLHNPHGTNNTAELNALYQALLFAAEEVEADRSVRVLSDSRYAINCISQWASGWEKKGWRKKEGEIKNLEIIQQAYALYESIKSEIHLAHVAAHVGTEGNELADRMAMHAVISREKEWRQYEGEMDIAKILRMRAG